MHIRDTRTIFDRRLHAIFEPDRTIAPREYYTMHTEQTANEWNTQEDKKKKNTAYRATHSTPIEQSPSESSLDTPHTECPKYSHKSWLRLVIFRKYSRKTDDLDAANLAAKIDILTFFFQITKKKWSMKKATKHFDRWSIVHRHNRLWTRGKPMNYRRRRIEWASWKTGLNGEEK